MQSSLNSAVNRFKRLAILTSVTCPRSKNNITPRMDTKSLNALPKTKVRFIEPMYALAIQKLPQGQEWLYEVKFDGYRCLAGIDASGVTLWSRRGNLFTNQFPHIAGACERLPPGTLVDGEIVALGESGRVSFNLLQHHRSKAQALVFYVFDVLAYRDRSLLNEPLKRRRETLSEMFKGVKTAPIALSESLNASPDELIYVAKVRNGFVTQLRREVTAIREFISSYT